MTRKIQPKNVVLEGGSGFFWKLWGNYHKKSIANNYLCTSTKLQALF